MICKTLFSIVFSACAGVIFLGSAADAQSNDCRQEDKLEQIEACTAQIARGGDEARVGTGYLYRCQAYDILGEYQPALADCKSALSYMPRDSSIHNSMAIIYQNMGQYTLAVQSSTQAITLKSDIGSYWNTRANNYCKAKRIDKSVADRLEALDRGAFSAETLQRVLAQRGFYSGAVDGKVGDGTIRALFEWTKAGC